MKLFILFYLMDFYVSSLWGFQFLFCKSNFGYARKDWIFILVCFERMFIAVFAPANCLFLGFWGVIKDLDMVFTQSWGVSLIPRPYGFKESSHPLLGVIFYGFISYLTVRNLIGNILWNYNYKVIFFGYLPMSIHFCVGVVVTKQIKDPPVVSYFVCNL